MIRPLKLRLGQIVDLKELLLNLYNIVKDNKINLEKFFKYFKDPIKNL
jgi:hypothetical protein